jgi:ankyrin repeat protein
MNKIALLLTILCLSPLHGMEPEKGRYIGMEELSPEVKALIIQALNAYNNNLSAQDNLKNTIRAIKAMSSTSQELHEIVNDLYGNQKGFTKLMHILANKYGTSTAIIAQIFRGPAADMYIKNGYALLWGTHDTNMVKQHISEGADVNFINEMNITPLKQAMINLNPEAVQLLLNAGANPEPALLDTKLIERQYQYGENGEKAKAIQKMITQAIELKK